MPETLQSIVRYSRQARWLHWTIFGLVALTYLLINLRGVFPRGSDAVRTTMASHYMAGLAVLVLVLPRLLHRRRNTPPPISPPLLTWETWLSRLTHVALYAFLVVQPLMGLATVLTNGPLPIPFTSLRIASPLTRDHALHESIGHLHGTIGTVFYWVIGLHITAALWHHFFRRDDTLRRML